MPEKQEFGSNIEQIKIDLKAPKTAEEWCELYRELTDKDIYASMNWGNEDEARILLTHDEFQKKAKACKINLADSDLITEANRKIQE